MIFLDTHMVVWLYEGDLALIPVEVRRRIDAEPLVMSPYVRFELTFLREVGKITVTESDIIGDLGRRLELAVSDSSVDAICRAAQELTWTRDPFDRLIAAHAVTADMPLVTKDRTIRSNLALAWWGD